MKRIGSVVIALVATFALQAHPRDAKSTFDLVSKGKALSASDAKKLEDRLKQKPGDEESRIELLSYYAGSPADLDLSVVKTARSRHILWLIENDPEDGLGLFQIGTGIYRLHCQGDDLADPDAFGQARQMWLKQVQKKPDDAAIRRAAVAAIQFCSPEDAEKILTEANDASGLGRLYAGAILGVTGQSYQNSDPAGSDAALRARPFAEKAQRELAGATNGDLIVAAVETLLGQGAILWADGKLDWDYTPIGAVLLAKAKTLYPDGIALLTLPTKLPERGERPPITIRVGGNVLGSKQVRKVAPVYPAVARDRGIEGTVRLHAMIGLDGKVLYLRAIAGPAELIPPSVEAVQQWEYQITRLNGKPCYVESEIDLRYTLSRP